MEENLKNNFLDLCQKAYDTDLKVEDIVEVEPLMVSLIELVKNNPEHRSLFV